MDCIDTWLGTEGASACVMTFGITKLYTSKDDQVGSIGEKLSLVVTEE